MANNGPNTNGCQFFLIYSAQPHLNNMYTIFGQVRVRVRVSVSVRLSQCRTSIQYDSHSHYLLRTVGKKSLRQNDPVLLCFVRSFPVLSSLFLVCPVPSVLSCPISPVLYSTAQSLYLAGSDPSHFS
jgi:hypothetical protein